MVKVHKLGLLVALLAAPLTAHAGGVITDGRTSVPQQALSATTNVSVATVSLALPVTANVTVSAASVPRTATPPPATGTGAGTGTGGGAITPLELKQIEEGLITYEEATSGCASSGGAAGLLPLALVGLALRRRR